MILFLVGNGLSYGRPGILEEYDALQHFAPLLKQGLVKDYHLPLLLFHLLGYLLNMVVHNGHQSLSNALRRGRVTLRVHRLYTLLRIKIDDQGGPSLKLFLSFRYRVCVIVNERVCCKWK